MVTVAAKTDGLEIVKLTVRIDKELKNRLKAMAALRNRTLNDFYAEWLHHLVHNTAETQTIIRGDFKPAPREEE